MMQSFGLLIAALVVAIIQAQDVLKPTILKVEESKLLKSGPFGSQLYELIIPGSTYGDSPPYLLNLTSKSYEAGYDAGFLMGEAYYESFTNLFKSLFGDEWWEPEAAAMMAHFMDKQFEFLQEQLPQEYKDELEGASAGGEKVGMKGFMKDVGSIMKRSVVLANLPGSLSNFKFILADEKKHEHPGRNGDGTIFERVIEKWLKKQKNGENDKEAKERALGFTCSNYGVWGDRTVDGDLYTGRNLDWMPDTGVSKHKLVTVHHPENGYSHADISFAGVWGAMTGMSSQGLTVHEANLESNDISFFGFPWLLRLRYIMSYAKNLQEGVDLWMNTNSTVGFNHGIGSAADKSAVLIETMAHSNKVFSSMDPRESASSTGNPRSDAVYRTNHGYDPYTVEHYMWNNTGAYTNSLQRYELFPELFDEYKSRGVSISPLEAVNITAVVADKGSSLAEAYTCVGPTYPTGENILSVTYHPASLTAYVAWESGSGDQWVPAACNTYVELDLSQWY